MTTEKVDSYLRLTFWAARRYRRNGSLLVATGNTPSRYSLIERAAWRKYMA